MKPLSTTTFKLLQALYRAGREQEHAELALAHMRAGSRVQNAFVLDECPEQWQNFFEKGLRRLFEDRAGYIYIAVNDEQPDWRKIGKTRLEPDARMSALNNESVVGEIRCEFALPVHDRHYCEVAAHKWLKNRGFARKKEFFQAPPQDAQDAVVRVFEQDLISLAECDVAHLLMSQFSNKLSRN